MYRIRVGGCNNNLQHLLESLDCRSTHGLARLDDEGQGRAFADKRIPLPVGR